MKRLISPALLCFILATGAIGVSQAQTGPSGSEIANYMGLHRAAHFGEVDALVNLISEGADLEARDNSGRTPIHVAAFASRDEAVKILAGAGADLDALEHQDYDIVTIAAVANDYELMDLALKLGASPGNTTSPYDGTALIAAAHLGHSKVVSRLIQAGAPLDHVNNLGWTALIEAVILGNGGPDHVEIVRVLVEAGANRDIGDSNGVTPLQFARTYHYADIIRILEN